MPLYTKYTLISIPVIFVSMALIAIPLYLWLKNKSEKVKRIPFIVLALVFIGLELSKQIFEICRGYTNLFSIPLHICSFVVFFPIFAVFLNQEKTITKVFWALSVITTTTISAAMIIYPEIIIGGANKGILTGSTYYLDYHSVIHHTFIVLFFYLSILLRPWKPAAKESFIGLGVFAGFMALAWIMTKVLSVNFCAYTTYGTGFGIQLLIFLGSNLAYILGYFAFFGITKLVDKLVTTTPPPIKK